MAKRRNFTEQFKAKVALEALRGDKTATGNPIEGKSLTFQQLFAVIGLKDLYNPKNPNPDWKKIQSSVINYLGFVGFQFQESDLNDLGYYNYPYVRIGKKFFPQHYVDVPNSHWKNGVTHFLDTDPKEVSVPTSVTDTVNVYDNFFTGKNGVTSVAEFKNPDKHVLIIKDHFANKFEGIVHELAAMGKRLSEYIGTVVRWNGLTPDRNTLCTELGIGLLRSPHLVRLAPGSGPFFETISGLYSGLCCKPHRKGDRL